MNPSRQASILQGLTNVARKVYDAIPIETAWTHTQIATELRRSGCSVEIPTLLGCARVLVDRGLVRETARSTFQRVRIKATTDTPAPALVVVHSAPPPPKEPATMASPQPEQKKRPLSDRLGELAGRSRTLAAQLVELAEDVDEIALDIEADLSAKDADLKKLHQLQALLKGL